MEFQTQVVDLKLYVEVALPNDIIQYAHRRTQMSIAVANHFLAKVPNIFQLDVYDYSYDKPVDVTKIPTLSDSVIHPDHSCYRIGPFYLKTTTDVRLTQMETKRYFNTLVYEVSYKNKTVPLNVTIKSLTASKRRNNRPNSIKFLGGLSRKSELEFAYVSRDEVSEDN